MPSIFRLVATFARKALKKGKTAEKRLTAELDAAKRVNPAPRISEEYTDYTDRSRDSLRRILDTIEGDGLWTCCRGHEQELIHFNGAHPFKRLRCRQCKHIVCRRCCSTDVLTLFEYDQKPDVRGATITKVRPNLLGQICPGCGLSHRSRHRQEIIDPSTVGHRPDLTLKELICVCGRLSDKTWLRFYIGSIYEYRRNPHEAFAALSRQRAERSVRIQRERSQCNAQRASLLIYTSQSKEYLAVQTSLPISSPQRSRASSLLSAAHAQFVTRSPSSSPWGRSYSKLSQPPTPRTTRGSSISLVSTIAVP